MKLAEKKRMGTVIRAIFDVFGPSMVYPKDKSPYVHFHHRKVAARDALKNLPGSHVTVLRAREYLGVESRVIAGRHFWFAPTVPLASALEKAGRHSKSNLYKAAQPSRDRMERYAGELVPILQQILRSNNHDMPPDKVEEEVKQLTGRKFSNGIINLAKQRAGIISRKLVDKWHWLLEPENMQQWLEERLAQGPVLHDVLLEEVTRAGWTLHVLNLFRTGKGFGQRMKDGLWYWYDINTWSEE